MSTARQLKEKRTDYNNTTGLVKREKERGERFAVEKRVEGERELVHVGRARKISPSLLGGGQKKEKSTIIVGGPVGMTTEKGKKRCDEGRRG